MPSGFVHATFDLMGFGCHYLDLHQQKDAPWQELGTEHRSLHHEWYNAFGLDWDLRDPFPDALGSVIESIADKYGDAEAEASMAYITHDYVDRALDSFGQPEHKCIIVLCVWLLFNPDVLRDKYGVDVTNETIERTIEGRQIWEPAPGLAKEYQRLYKYASAIVERDHELASLLARCG